MEIIADFHIHSRFSRACSKQLTLPNIDDWARAKGIDLIGTGDFTHPVWFKEICDQLKPIRNGIFKLKPKLRTRSIEVAENPEVEFILSTEIATIWSQGGRVRRMHTVLLAPSIESVSKLIQKLSGRWKLASDGRPILGMSSRALAELCWEIDDNFTIIPAHAWTPWFAVFGSQSGFDSLEECFGDVVDRIPAIETGLSSDPAMNWRISALDKIALISNSDAHSLNNLGREASVFSIAQIESLNFPNIIKMISDGNPKYRQQNFHLTNSTSQVENFLKGTIEFFPEEGKYHYDGHRPCGVCLHPDKTKELKNRCPSCSRPITIGVYARVADLADRPEGFIPRGAPQVEHIVPLCELVSAAQNVGKLSKQVNLIVAKLRSELGSEFKILREIPLDQIQKVGSEKLAEFIGLVRAKKIKMSPGYDGVYGKLILPDSSTQPSLFM